MLTITEKENKKSTILLFVLGYFSLSILCILLLLLPVSRHEVIPFVDQLFMATSIVSTTGLSCVDFGNSYTLFGHIISLLFIQLGGVGYMALGSYLLLHKKENLPRISASLLRVEFDLPSRYPLRHFIYGVFIFTLLIEMIGAVFLYFGFKQFGLDNSAWLAIFHSISAFCTAGFSLFGDSMTPFSNSNLITNTILTLSILGSVGFIVLLDFWMKIRGRRKRVTLTSKIILTSTFLTIFGGTLLFFISDGVLINEGWNGFKDAFFQVVSAHTTVGFNNWDISNSKLGGILVLIIIMIIGASPAGTGGGIKTTSITALIGLLYSILRQRKYVTFFGKEIPDKRIFLAISSLLIYAVILLVASWIILQIDGDNFSFEKLIFEVSSALSTVGLSTGITAELSSSSKILIAFLMFVGRLGVLTFGFVLLSKAPTVRRKPKIEDLVV